MTNEQRQARRIMECEKADNSNITATELAEQAAWEMEHDEWLDDETHWIWDGALEVEEEAQ